jgi:hypothetical protein
MLYPIELRAPIGPAYALSLAAPAQETPCHRNPVAPRELGQKSQYRRPPIGRYLAQILDMGTQPDGQNALCEGAHRGLGVAGRRSRANAIGVNKVVARTMSTKAENTVGGSSGLPS